MTLRLFMWLLRPALMAVDGGSRNPLHVIAAVIALPLDVWLAHTIWETIAGKLQKGEWTISQSLNRLANDASNPRQHLFFAIAIEVNKISPTGKHVEIRNASNST
jgi:hypothetical protein